MLYVEDSTSDGAKLLTMSPFNRPSQIKHNESQGQELKYSVTKLQNGVTVLTESTTVPSTVQMGILINVGTRDETPETSGSLLSIKNTYLKTVLNTNETINYGVTQMSGGSFEMDYDRENTYWKASCLAHDVVDVFSMMVDCAFEPRSVVAANVGMYKNTQSHKLEEQNGNITFNDNLFKIAYGPRGLGNPLLGSKGNIGNLTADTLQKFQLDNISPDKVVVCGAGIDNHQEFVDLVQEKLLETPLPSGSNKRHRDVSTYTGGEVRIPGDGILHAAFAFEGLSFKDSIPLLIARKVLGQNRYRGRVQSNIISKHPFVSHGEPFKYSHSDSGIFGLHLTGSAAHGKEVIDSAINELKSLTNIRDEEIRDAKNLLKVKLFNHLEDPATRVEDAAKSLLLINSPSVDFAKQIDAVTTSQVEEAVRKALKSKPVILVKGGDISSISSYDSLANKFN